MAWQLGDKQWVMARDNGDALVGCGIEEFLTTRDGHVARSHLGGSGGGKISRKSAYGIIFRRGVSNGGNRYGMLSGCAGRRNVRALLRGVGFLAALLSPEGRKQKYAGPS